MRWLELELLAKRFDEKRQEAMDRWLDALDRSMRLGVGHPVERAQLVTERRDALEQMSMFSELASEARSDARRSLGEAEAAGVIHRGHLMPRSWFREQAAGMERRRSE